MIYFTKLNGDVVQVDNWNDFNEPILQMGIPLNSEQIIVMEGFEAYLRLKEEVQGVFRNFHGVSKILLFGKRKDKVAVVILDCIKHTISQDIRPINQAYQNKPLTSHLWKQGVVGNSKIYIKE